jgi:tRNA nucleotidyltransferase (CCA-adding enzyme)
MQKRAIDTWIIYFMAMADRLTLNHIKLMCDRFVFTKGDTKRILSAKIYANRTAKVLDEKYILLPSQVYKYLEPLSYETILFIMAKTRTKEAKKRISMFFTKYNNTRLAIAGSDLKRTGLTPGPKYKMILDKVLCAKLDGKVKNKKDELGLAQRLT